MFNFQNHINRLRNNGKAIGNKMTLKKKPLPQASTEIKIEKKEKALRIARLDDKLLRGMQIVGRPESATKRTCS